MSGRDLDALAGRRRRAVEHELRTPITCVRALLQSLLIGSIPDDARLDLLRRAVRECDRLDRVVDRLLGGVDAEGGETDASASGNTRA